MAPTFALLICLHLLAATVWVGGMVVMHFAVRPAAIATLPPPQRLPLMTQALGRFFNWVTAAIVLLLGTGATIIMLAGGMGAMHWSVHAMIGLGLVMMAIFGHIRMANYPRLQRAVAEQRWPDGAAALDSIRAKVLLNLCLGIVVYVVAVVARVL